MLDLQVIIAATRAGRQGAPVGGWFFEVARAHAKFNVELIDLAEVNLPMFDEPKHPRFQQYEHEHTKAWSATIDRADAYVFVTPEYDFSAPASLINAVQTLFNEWAYKPAGFASYGGVSGGTRGVQMSKQVVSAVKMVPMVETVAIPFFAQYLDKESGAFDPGELQVKSANIMLDELLKWATALKPLRSS